MRCLEVDQLQHYAADADTLHKRMFNMLCRGPRFTVAQSDALSTDLFRMQSAFVETQLCVPKHLDLCMNLDHIWDFTYVRRPNTGQLERLNMTDVSIKLLGMNIVKTNCYNFPLKVQRNQSYNSTMMAIWSMTITL